MSSVFVIVNESTIRGVDYPTVEYVQPMHSTLEGAVQALFEIAEDAGVDMNTFNGDTENSVYLPVEGTPFESDEYYIEEVEVVD